MANNTKKARCLVMLEEILILTRLCATVVALPLFAESIALALPSFFLS